MAHASHAHIRHDGQHLVDVAAMSSSPMASNGPRCAQVFAILAGFANPARAYDVAERVGSALERRVAPNSIYRILDLFVARNLALRIESRNAYLANNHPGCVHDCIFLICDDCGATTHIDDDKTARTVRNAASRDGFLVKRPVIEVRGTSTASHQS